MYTFVKFDYLAAASLVELKERKSINYVTFEDIKAYGASVKIELQKKNIDAILQFSNEYVEEFVENYSELFEVKNSAVHLKTAVEPDEIRKKILRYMSANVLLTLLEEKTLSAIKSLK